MFLESWSGGRWAAAGRCNSVRTRAHARFASGPVCGSWSSHSLFCCIIGQFWMARGLMLTSSGAYLGAAGCCRCWHACLPSVGHRRVWTGQLAVTLEWRCQPCCSLAQQLGDRYLAGSWRCNLEHVVCRCSGNNWSLDELLDVHQDANITARTSLDAEGCLYAPVIIRVTAQARPSFLPPGVGCFGDWQAHYVEQLISSVVLVIARGAAELAKKRWRSCGSSCSAMHSPLAWERIMIALEQHDRGHGDMQTIGQYKID